MSCSHPAWFDELSEWLEIPSISADPERAGAVRDAGEWLCAFIRAARGSGELIDWNGHPLAVGELPASTDPSSAPTVLVYGHFDVQPPGRLDEWTTQPFSPAIRGEWVYGRGVADDKGGLYLLAKAATELAREATLPVNVRFACDGEEESGGDSIVEFLGAHPPHADVCLIFDSLMLGRDRPAIVIGMRGILYYHLVLRSGDHDLHSGLVGGAGANATNELVRALAALLPAHGFLPEQLRTGVAVPSRDEVADWSTLPSGAEALAELGARPADDDAGAEFYHRVWAEPAFDVHGIAGGEPHLIKTITPALAEGNFSVRLAPGQSPAEVAVAVEQIVRQTVPSTVDIELALLSSTPPAQSDAKAPAIRAALDAFEEAFGARPVLIRSGGTLPAVAVLETLRIPTITTGFALPESNLHAPNERMLVDYFPRGIATARALYTRLGRLHEFGSEEGSSG